MSEDFSKIMDVLGNTIRRKILWKLSEGPDYVLRISQELQVGQQLIAKHIKILEEAGFVHPIWEKSTRGANKKMYTIDKFYSVRIDFSPNLYNETLILFDDPLGWIENSNKLDELEERLTNIQENIQGIDQINPLNIIISEIDYELEEMEKKRTRLLYLRNMVKENAINSMNSIDRREKQLIHHIIESGPSSVNDISKNLQIREESVRQLVRELIKKDLIIDSERGISIRS